MGIEAEDMKQLFSQFGRLHRTAEMNHDGIGLGLTIVKQIVEAGGGTVSVQSDGAGNGSSFTFYMVMKPAMTESNHSTNLLEQKLIKQ